MKRKRHQEEQIIRILREAERGEKTRLGSHFGRNGYGHVIERGAFIDLSYIRGPWIAAVILDTTVSDEAVDRFAKECIERQVLYVCCIGTGGRRAEKVFDRWAAMYEEGTSGTIDERIVVTTSAATLEEGTWEVMASSSHPDLAEDIPEVHFFSFCGEQPLLEVEYIIKNLNAGWLPNG